MSTVDVRAPVLDLSCTLNGRQVTLAARAGSRLLDVLREEGHLTGVKEGCGEGECGACTVLLDDQVICSCVTLAQTAEGAEVVTVEGLGDRIGADVHPVQEHFVREMGTQCGFCTPGMVLSAVALLEENPAATREEILDGISGNLCRCTGYVRIVKAIEDARDEMAGG
jgi:aerobic-type carbon monoxide dehydrogenase small subunit (CoxS/CutS family)